VNIFVLSHDPIEAGRFLCDQHLRDCSTNYTQLLVNQHNALRQTGAWKKPSLTGVYTTPQKRDHSCNKWVAQGAANYGWLLELTKSVWVEYKTRFKVTHICENTFAEDLKTIPGWMGGGHMTTPPICLPEKWQPPTPAKKGSKLWDCIDAYRGFYKFVNGTWTVTPEPAWMAMPTNRVIHPLDPEVNLEGFDFLQLSEQDAEFQRVKAAVDAKYD
jgi:hypothetical protein